MFSPCCTSDFCPVQGISIRVHPVPDIPNTVRLVHGRAIRMCPIHGKSTRACPVPILLPKCVQYFVYQLGCVYFLVYLTGRVPDVPNRVGPLTSTYKLEPGSLYRPKVL